MGCGASAARYAVPARELAENGAVFRTLGLSERDVRKLFGVFARIDTDASGQLSLAELLDHLEVKKTTFTTRVFSIFDEDGSGEVDFREFVLSLWNYCTLSKYSLVMFAFDLYDKDSSGAIELNEMKDLCKDVYGAGFERNRLAVQILEKIDRMSDVLSGGEISVDRFANFCESHPALLYPAFSFQQSLQKLILGHGFWHKVGKHRVTLPTGVQVSVKELIKAHVDTKKFKEMALHDRPGAERLLTKAARASSRKIKLQGSKNDIHEFKEVFEATGTVSKRRSTAATKLQGAAHKLKAAQALQGAGKHRKTENLHQARSMQRRTSSRRLTHAGGSSVRSQSQLQNGVSSRRVLEPQRSSHNVKSKRPTRVHPAAGRGPRPQRHSQRK